MVSRRNFLKRGTLGAVAAGISINLAEKAVGRPGTPEPASLLPAPAPSFNLDRAAFASQLNTTFQINDGAREVALKLVEVVDLGSARSVQGRKEAFALKFRADGATNLVQNTYAIKHAELGDFAFLVVPSFSRDRSCRYYEVNVNRLHS